MNEDILDEDLAYEAVKHPASMVARLINGVVDFMVIALLASPYSISSQLLPYIFYVLFEYEGPSDETVQIMNPIFIYILYYFFLEVTIQRTVGKFITNTRVYTIDGYKPTPGQIMKRTLLRLTIIEAFTYLFNYNFHDRFSATTVSKISKF